LSRSPRPDPEHQRGEKAKGEHRQERGTSRQHSHAYARERLGRALFLCACEVARLLEQRIEHRRCRERLFRGLRRFADIAIRPRDREPHLESPLHRAELLERAPIIRIECVRAEEVSTKRIGGDAQALGLDDALESIVEERRLRRRDVAKGRVVALEERGRLSRDAAHL
jgi:hypothetical protein